MCNILNFYMKANSECDDRIKILVQYVEKLSFVYSQYFNCAESELMLERFY